jgi:23S rRNA (cytosine1962-C5)-methyltransferase
VLARTLFEIDRRNRIFSNSENQCFRLAKLNNNQGGTDYTLDQLGEALVLNWHKQWWGDDEINKFSQLAKLLNKVLVVNQVSTKIKSILNPSEKINNINSKWTAFENKTLLQFSVDTVFNATHALSLRLHRHYLSQHANSKSVLNLFLGASGYAVAAAAAITTETATAAGNTNASVLNQQVINVELSKNLLAAAKANLELNNLNSEKNIFLCRDSLTYVEQCLKKEIKFDIITCEVPSFFKREKSTFKIKNDLEGFVKNAIFCLAPKGQLLISTHSDDFYIDDLRKIFLKIQTDLKLENIELSSILPSMDFELSAEPAQLKSFLLCIG